MQKIGVPGYQLIRKATRINHGDLTAFWLDLANDNGSDTHSLIMKALQRYHLPDKIQEIVNVRICIAKTVTFFFNWFILYNTEND